MLEWLLSRRITAFERQWDYDMTYARALLAADAGALLALARVTSMSNDRRDVPLDVYHAAKVTAVLAEDCGPCTQLAVSMALRQGVPGATLAAVISGDRDALSEPVRLAAAFARAALAHDPGADALRSELERRYGQRGIISLCFAITAARIYPTLEYALGHGASCQRVVIEGQAVVPDGRGPGERASTLVDAEPA